MNPADRPIWHRDGSTSVRQAHKDDKMKRCEIWVRDAQNTGCEAQGGERGGTRLVFGKEVRKKGKGNKRMNEKEKGMVRKKGEKKVTIEAFYFFLVRRKEVSS